MVPKLWCTGRNAQQSRWSLSQFKVSLRPNSQSIFSGSIMSLTTPSMFYLHAGRNTKPTSQPFTFSLVFKMTLGWKHDPGSSVAEASGHPEHSLLLSAPRQGKTWTVDAHRMSTACKQYGHTAHDLPVTYWLHSNSSHEILVTPIVLMFCPEKLWSIALAHTTEGLRQTTRNFDLWWTNSICFFTFIFNSWKCLLRFKKQNKQHLQRWTTL